MIKKVLLILSFLLSALLLPDSKIIPIEEVLRPQAIRVYSNRLFIIEGARVSIFSLKDFRLIKAFGKKGEGPKEFMLLPTKRRVDIFFDPQKIHVHSVGKYSFYTLDGDFLSEQRIAFQFPFPTADIIPLKDKYFVQQLETEPKKKFWRAFNLYDANFKKVKVVKRVKIDNDKIYLKWDISNDFHVSGDRVYIVASGEFLVEAFDSNGDKLYSIEREYQRKKVTSKDIKEFHERYRVNARNRVMYSLLKDKFTFSDKFPAIDEIYATNDKLYVMTYRYENDLTETFIYDMNGKFVKQIWMPILRNMPGGSGKFIIERNCLYQLYEDDESEQWVLRIDSIY